MWEESLGTQAGVYLIGGVRLIQRQQQRTLRTENEHRGASVDIKQLLDEVEHDIMNYQNRGLCYLPKPKAEADNTDTRFS